MAAYNFTDKELKLLSTSRAVKMMMQQGDNINPKSVLRFIKYENYLEKLQVELIKMQTWVIKSRQRICIIFEGRDVAGKGGAIRRVTHHLNPDIIEL